MTMQFVFNTVMSISLWSPTLRRLPTTLPTTRFNKRNYKRVYRKSGE